MKLFRLIYHQLQGREYNTSHILGLLLEQCQIYTSMTRETHQEQKQQEVDVPSTTLSNQHTAYYNSNPIQPMIPTHTTIIPNALLSSTVA